MAVAGAVADKLALAVLEALVVEEMVLILMAVQDHQHLVLLIQEAVVALVIMQEMVQAVQV
jgi:hypothetical protein